MAPSRFQNAIEAGDPEAVRDSLSADAVFNSLVAELTVMLRPMSGMSAMADAMRQRLAPA
jgi:hypothetical protein